MAPRDFWAWWASGKCVALNGALALLLQGVIAAGGELRCQGQRVTEVAAVRGLRMRGAPRDFVAVYNHPGAPKTLPAGFEAAASACAPTAEPSDESAEGVPHQACLLTTASGGFLVADIACAQFGWAHAGSLGRGAAMLPRACCPLADYSAGVLESLDVCTAMDGDAWGAFVRQNPQDLGAAAALEMCEAVRRDLERTP